MKRIIVDFKKLNEAILDLLVQRYPDGYSHKDIVTFRNAQGDLIEAVEVKSEDTVYLVKIGSYLNQVIEDHSDLYYADDDDENTDEDTISDDFETEIEDYDYNDNDNEI